MSTRIQDLFRNIKAGQFPTLSKKPCPIQFEDLLVQDEDGQDIVSLCSQKKRTQSEDSAADYHGFLLRLYFIVIKPHLAEQYELDDRGSRQVVPMTEKVPLIQTRGPNLQYKVDQNQQTLLHWAAATGYATSELVLLDEHTWSTPLELIMSESETGLNPLDKAKRTPLMLACKNGHLSVVEALIASMHVDNLELKDIHGRTALDYAREAGHQDIVEAFENFKNKRTPLILACIAGNLPEIENILNKVVVAGYLNAKDIYGLTAFDYARQADRQDIVATLETFIKKDEEARSKDREYFAQARARASAKPANPPQVVPTPTREATSAAVAKQPTAPQGVQPPPALNELTNFQEGARLKAASEREFQPGSLSDLDKLNREFPLSQIDTVYDDTLKNTYNSWQSLSYIRLDEAKRQLLIKISAGNLPTEDEIASLTFNDLKARNKNNLNIVATCSLLIRWHRDHGQPDTAQYYEWLLKNIYHNVIVRHFYSPTEKREPEDHTLFHWAAAAGQVDEVEKLYNPEDIEKYYRERQNKGTAYSPLRWACTNGHLEVVRKLTTLGLPVNTADGPSKLTPLHMAEWAGHDDIVILLREQKAEPAADSTGLYPAYYDTERRLMRQTRQAKAEAELAAANPAAAAANPPVTVPQSTVVKASGAPQDQDAQPNPPVVVPPSSVHSDEASSKPPLHQEQTEDLDLQLLKPVNPLIGDLRKLVDDWKNETGARSRLKRKMIENMIPILEAEDDQRPEHLFSHYVAYDDLKLTPQEVILFRQQQQTYTMTLKEILDYQRKLFKPRGSTEFFKKPESSRNLLMKHYPIKRRLLDYIDSVQKRYSRTEPKYRHLDELKGQIQQSDFSHLRDYMEIRTEAGKTLGDILDIQRKIIKTKHAKALKDFYKNFADKIEEEGNPSLKK